MSIGKTSYGPTKSEKENLKFRRSIYVSKDIEEGEEINNTNLKIVRPSYGAHPKFFNSIIGKKAIKSLKAGTPFKLEFIKK